MEGPPIEAHHIFIVFVAASLLEVNPAVLGCELLILRICLGDLSFFNNFIVPFGAAGHQHPHLVDCPMLLPSYHHYTFTWCMQLQRGLAARTLQPIQLTDPRETDLPVV